MKSADSKKKPPNSKLTPATSEQQVDDKARLYSVRREVTLEIKKSIYIITTNEKGNVHVKVYELTHGALNKVDVKKMYFESKYELFRSDDPYAKAITKAVMFDRVVGL